MKRALIKKMLEWKNRTDRKPLILRGVRQCGKTYLLKSFAAQYYDNVAYFNFEDGARLSKIFEVDYDVRRIIFELSLMNGTAIECGKTLIIFDEIQECGRAITALKYFAENAPGYHIVCAGSLLGIALQQHLSFPVGKVDFLTLHPMSFAEFVRAVEGDMLGDFVENFNVGSELPVAVAEKLELLLREYYVTGGMPAVVNSWRTDRNINDVERIQQSILDSYELDFVKHAPVKEFTKLTAIWRSIPEQLSKENSKFIFSHVKDGLRAKDLEDSLEWLISAGLAYKVNRIEKPNMPLSAYANDTSFKLYLADVGLLRKLARLPQNVVLDGDSAYKEFKGAMTENFVLCELATAGNVPAYYWTSGNMAEVDFVVQLARYIVPVEVKSERNVKTRSLAEYNKKYANEKSVKTSMRPEIKSGSLLHVPLYLFGAIDKLIDV